MIFLLFTYKPFSRVRMSKIVQLQEREQFGFMVINTASIEVKTVFTAFEIYVLRTDQGYGSLLQQNILGRIKLKECKDKGRAQYAISWFT